MFVAKLNINVTSDSPSKDESELEPKKSLDESGSDSMGGQADTQKRSRALTAGVGEGRSDELTTTAAEESMAPATKLTAAEIAFSRYSMGAP